MRKELENRLIKMAQNINKLCKNLDGSFIAIHLSKQIIRSSTSAALNYGEAQASESRKDFIHKIGIVLKELRETQISLELLGDSTKRSEINYIEICADECAQLVAIFHKTVMTAKSNL